ncbi:hypothetical protein LXA43DRAFT_198536 [Ganoderma leucocontextum]|nr:hypothetical protein LXA43DRAFT_198536 [Ganoderma leucocontextum]
MAPQEVEPPPQGALVHAPYGSSSASPSTGPHTLCEAICQELAELDAKEKAVMEPISCRRLELKRLWNRSLLIHKLPNELLTHIFAHLPHTPWKRRDRSTNGQPAWLDLGWPCLMLVCRHWRDLLVSTPAFWRQVNFMRKTKWTKLCLSRSAAASIDVNVGRGCYLDRLNDLHPHVHRFKQFRYCDELDNPHLLTALAPLFNSGMPLLEKLHFTVGKVWHKPTAHIDVKITSQRFPSLRALKLTSPIMVAPQEISLYAQLRKLTLYDCSPTLSLDGFLDVLAASMQLEELILHGTLHRLSGEWSHEGLIPHRPPISLPRLRKFTLDEYRIVRISRFLAHLHLQPFVVLWMQGRADMVANTIDAMLPPNRFATLPVLGLGTNIYMEVRGDLYSIHCGYVRPSVDRPGDSPRVLLKLHPGYRAGGWDRAMARVLDDLVQSFGPSPLTRLNVDGDQSYGTAAAWERVFRTFPLLEELDVNKDCYRDTGDVSVIFHGLHAASVAHADSGVACPNLKDIRVQGGSTPATYEAMWVCFRYRCERGVLLDSLNVESLLDRDELASTLRRGFIEDMSGVVKCVHAGPENILSESAEEQYEDDSDGLPAIIMG